MEKYFDPQYLFALVNSIANWLLGKVLTGRTLVEAAVVVFCLLAGYLLARPVNRPLTRFLESAEWRDKLPGRMIKALVPLVKFLFAVFLLWIAHAAVRRYNLPGLLVDTAASLLTAWAIIRFSTSLMGDSNWVRLIAISSWAVAALHIVKLLDPTIALLDRAAITIGGVRVSILLLFKGVVIFAALLRGASSAAVFLEKRIQTLEGLSPSVQVLLGKALKVTLLVVAVVVALGSLGIDLSAFAFIGGAIGVGIGFGLQKVVSNLISGVILLLDKSIKPGDVIQLGDNYGRIQSLGARYVSVATRDGTEFLIPNEDLITQQVVNWSFTDKLVRLKIAVGISYNSNVHTAIDLVIAAARDVPRILDDPAPVCHVKNFGDNSVDLELRVWIGDPEKGISNVSSEVRLAIWDAFGENGIEIPFPQRDVHIKSQPASI